jgi:hypothetical protein
MDKPRRGRPPKQPEKVDGFPMVVTAPWVSIGPETVQEGGAIVVGAQERASLLFWKRARDA